MKVDLLYSMPHYEAHMRPIWELLPDDVKGSDRRDNDMPHRNHIGMVAGWQDVVPMLNRAKFFYVEHGAGQTYGGDEKMSWQRGYSGSGGKWHTGCLGFICPSTTVAKRWITAPAIAVGCPKIEHRLDGPAPSTPAVCIAWHWDCRIGPEGMSAYEHYAPRLAEIVEHFKAQGFYVYGHSHPRWEGRLDADMEAAGMGILHSDEEVFDTATHLLMDNSSLMYEFAALDRPVIALNAPWYRRNIDHGLRFWSHVPGRPVDSPEELLAVDLREPEHPADVFARVEAVCHAYSWNRGRGAQDAADFIAAIARSR